MKTSLPPLLQRLAAGFTLIEMIGVLAIMTIMAGVLTPNVLRSVERAAIVGEQQTMHNFGMQVKKYFHDFGVPPGANTWAADIATYSEWNVLDIVTNRRKMDRVFIFDPAVPPSGLRQRAIILSSMSTGMALPTAANINTPIRFNALWDTPDGQVPSATSWNGWTATAADHLVIERINFRSEYRTIYLQNRGNTYVVAPAVAPDVRYEVRLSSGIIVQQGKIVPGQTVTLTLVPNERINLFTGPLATEVLDYTYVIGISTTDKTFDYNSTHWIPQ